jgi:hypothetical protein
MECFKSRFSVSSFFRVLIFYIVKIFIKGPVGGIRHSRKAGAELGFGTSYPADFNLQFKEFSPELASGFICMVYCPPAVIAAYVLLSIRTLLRVISSFTPFRYP